MLAHTSFVTALKKRVIFHWLRTETEIDQHKELE